MSHVPFYGEGMKREIRIPAALKLAAKVLAVEEGMLAELLLEGVTGEQAWKAAKAIKEGGRQ